MKTKAEIEKRIEELKVKRDSSEHRTFEEQDKLDTQIDTLEWVLISGYSIWLD